MGTDGAENQGDQFSGVSMRLFLIIMALAVIWVAAIVLMGLLISDSPITLRDLTGGDEK